MPQPACPSHMTCPLKNEMREAEKRSIESGLAEPRFSCCLITGSIVREDKQVVHRTAALALFPDDERITFRHGGLGRSLLERQFPRYCGQAAAQTKAGTVSKRKRVKASGAMVNWGWLTRAHPN